MTVLSYFATVPITNYSQLFEAGEAALHKLKQDWPADDNANYGHYEENKRKEYFDGRLQGNSLPAVKPLSAGIFRDYRKSFSNRSSHALCLNNCLHK